VKKYHEIAGKTPSAMPTFLLGAGPDRQLYTLIDSYCEEPECVGTETFIDLVPERGPASILSFHANIFDGKVSFESDPGDKVGDIAVNFVQDHVDLFLRRRQVVRAWGLAKLRRKADYEPAMTYSFQDFRVVDDVFALQFAHQGQRWGAIDTYCGRPECPCTDAFLQFFAERGGGGVIHPKYCAVVDLKTGKTRTPDEKPLAKEPAALLASLQESLGDWCGELSLRKDLLRRVASKRLRFPPAVAAPGLARGAAPALAGGAAPARGHEWPALAPPAPAGLLPPSYARPPAPPIQAAPRRVCRNDPCPCGSGRKYKNCCAK
jgi:hypothetical protein